MHQSCLNVLLWESGGQAEAEARLCVETARPRNWVLAEKEVGPWTGGRPRNSHASERPVDGFHDVKVSPRAQCTLCLHPHSLFLESSMGPMGACTQ